MLTLYFWSLIAIGKFFNNWEQNQTREFQEALLRGSAEGPLTTSVAKPECAWCKSCLKWEKLSSEVMNRKCWGKSHLKAGSISCDKSMDDSSHQSKKERSPSHQPSKPSRALGIVIAIGHLQWEHFYHFVGHQRGHSLSDTENGWSGLKIRNDDGFCWKLTTSSKLRKQNTMETVTLWHRESLVCFTVKAAHKGCDKWALVNTCTSSDKQCSYSVNWENVVC